MNIKTFFSNLTKRKGRITEGGILPPSPAIHHVYQPRTDLPDIILQMPSLFMFDMNSYMQSINSAKAIDFSSRVLLYDMYESCLLDPFLSGVIDKRRIGVSRMPIEFRRNGKPVDEVNLQIRAPWFRKFLKDVLDSKLWGYALFQFYRNEKDGYINYYKVPYKHYDPIKRQLLRNQEDQTGIPIEAFDNMLCVCDDPRSLGVMAELVPMVLYKRKNMGDWAMFCQIFGMPIREYTYDAGDEDARRKLLMDARQQGSNGVYIHPKESALNIIESANKSGTVDLYERFKDACNKEISIRILGNTLTTDAQKTGTQSLGQVHQEEEDMIKIDDRSFVLDVLNYDIADIFSSLGINTEGGEFVYVETLALNPNQQVDVIQKAMSMGLPVGHDYMYKVLQIEKPEDYDQQRARMKAEKEAQRKLQEQVALAMPHRNSQGEESPKDDPKHTNVAENFFDFAPQDDGAPLAF